MELIFLHKYVHTILGDGGRDTFGAACAPGKGIAAGGAGGRSVPEIGRRRVRGWCGCLMGWLRMSAMHPWDCEPF